MGSLDAGSASKPATLFRIMPDSSPPRFANHQLHPSSVRRARSRHPDEELAARRVEPARRRA
jgi:hypothetical protein